MSNPIYTHKIVTSGAFAQNVVTKDGKKLLGTEFVGANSEKHRNTADFLRRACELMNAEDEAAENARAQTEAAQSELALNQPDVDTCPAEKEEIE